MCSWLCSGNLNGLLRGFVANLGLQFFKAVVKMLIIAVYFWVSIEILFFCLITWSHCIVICLILFTKLRDMLFILSPFLSFEMPLIFYFISP